MKIEDWTLGSPGVDDRNIKTFEVSDVPGRERRAAGLGYSRDQRVAEVGNSTGALLVRGELGRNCRSCRVEVQDTVCKVFGQHPVKCALETSALLATWEQRQAESGFEDGDARHPDRIGGLTVQPVHDGNVWSGPHECGQHVRVENDHQSKSGGVTARPRHSGRSAVRPER